MEPASARSADAGFTLIEVIVAMVLIGGAMLTVLAASTSGFAFQNIARQRQAAVGVANQVLEKIHALPYSEVQLGIVFDGTGTGSDPHIAKCRKNTWRLVACSADGKIAGAGEQIVRRASGGQSPLNPNHGSQTLNGIEYRWYAYISRVSAAKPYRITTIVDWTWQGETKSVNLQTVLWVPDGCNGVGTHPVAGPCVGGLSLSGQATGVQINVTAPSMTPFSVSLGSTGVTYNSEQTTVVTGTLTVPEPTPVTRSVVADNDPTNGIPAQTDLISAAGATQQLATGTPFVSGTSTWTIDARYSAVPTLNGKTRAGITENGILGTCTGTTATGSPCAGTAVTGDGGYLQIRATCNPCPTPTGNVWLAKPLADNSTLYLANVYPGWAVRSNISTSGSTKTLSLTRSFPTLQMGMVGYGACAACRWMSEIAVVSQTVTANVGASLTTPTPPTPTIYTRTPVNPVIASTCKDATSSETEAVSGAAAFTNTRCLVNGAYAGDVSFNALRYHFGAMTFVGPTASAGQLTGPTLSFTFDIQYCTTKVTTGKGGNAVTSCSTWSPLTPTFTVAVNFASMGVVGGSTAW